MDKKEIVLHLGRHKTGSTSIQYTLYDTRNNTIFKENNIQFIENWDSNNSVQLFSAFEDNNGIGYVHNIREGRTLDDLKVYNENIREELKRNLNKEGRLLLTAEDLTSLKGNELQNFKSFISNNCEYEVEIKVIMFVRSPVTVSSSIYQQLVRNGGKPSEENILDDYYRNTKNVTEIFGNEATEIYSFEEACKDELGLVGFFFRKLGMNSNDLNQMIFSRSNEAMCAEAVNIAHFIEDKQPMYDTPISINKYRDGNDIAPLTRIKGSKYNVPIEILTDEITNVMEDLIWLRDSYGIDYTVDIEKIKMKELEEITYDELSVIETFEYCSDFVKQCIVEYLFVNGNTRLSSELKSLLTSENTTNEENELFQEEMKVFQKVNFHNTGEIFDINIDGFTESEQFLNFTNMYGKIVKLEQNKYYVEFSKSKYLADAYRELARCFESIGDISYAYKYMYMAKILRPEGPFIRMKVEEYRAILNTM